MLMFAFFMLSSEPGPRHQAVRDRPRGRDHLRRDRDPGGARAVADEDARRAGTGGCRSRRRRCCSCGSPSPRANRRTTRLAAARLAPCAGSAGSSPRAVGSTASGSPRCPRRSSTVGRTRTGPSSTDGVGLAARRLAIIDLTSRRPADLERGRHVHRRPERRDLQLRRAAPRARARRPPMRDRTRTPRRSCTPTSNGAWLRRAAAWDVRDCDLGCDAQAARARARPVRDQAAVLPRRSTASCRSPRSSTRCPRASSTSMRSRRTSPSTAMPGPLSIFREIRKLQPGHVLTWEEGRARAGALRPTGAGRGTARRRRGGAGRGMPRAAARLGARAPRRRTCPVGVLLSGGVDSGTLDRVRPRSSRRSRCGRSRSGSRSRRSTSSTGPGPCRRGTGRSIASSSLQARRRAAAAAARRGLRRAVRRRGGCGDGGGVWRRRRRGRWRGVK